jgi:hypothetical protein
LRLNNGGFVVAKVLVIALCLGMTMFDVTKMFALKAGILAKG